MAGEQANPSHVCSAEYLLSDSPFADGYSLPTGVHHQSTAVGLYLGSLGSRSGGGAPDLRRKPVAQVLKTNIYPAGLR